METTALSLAKSVLNGAVAKATSVITEEVALQLGVRRDVAFINDEFEMMQTFLLAADEERGEKKVVRTWVKQVRDLGYDVEDCLQDFSLHLEKPSWWRFPCTMWKRRSIANEIIDLRARVEDVSHRNLRYRLIEDPSSKPTTAADRYLSSTAAVFGIDGARRAAKLENEKVDLVDLITKDDEDLRVITVWGTSNDLGKMSTIRKAYEDPKITEKFRCRAWVKLVNPFDPDEFLRSLVRQFYGNSNLIGTPKQGRTMGVHISKSMAAECDMENEFDKHVNQNQYMIVIEDLSTISEWDWIKLYLPDTKKGSRILVSTQQIELASLCVGQPNQVSELKQFSSDQSLYIFFHKEGNDPTETSLDAQRDRNVAAHETITELISQDLKTREVISVWGTDITQRTALVRSIYENQELDGKFQRCAWITVQHPIDHAVLLKSLIRELDGENLEAEAEELVEELASLLKGQMYLIVLDNISTSIAWDSIVSYFPAEECRSRIIVTTADGSVAKHCSEKHKNTHELEVQEGDIEADSNKNKEFKAIGLHSSFTESDLESNSILESAKDNGATLEEPELIGREEEKSRIIEMLLRPDGGNRYCVTSVWGMGGVGKTTLVESIYHCPKIIEEFPRRLWATLLQPFNPDVFKSGLASQLQAGSKIPNIIDIVKRGSTQSYSIVETGQLLGNITEKLLIVVDGISSEGEWDMVKTCLPENMASGSRIIVTTREASVAADCSVPRGNHINLQGLKYADAFKLFKTKISKLAEDFESDPEMMEQAERIIIKCGHLPLAIATIGGFLASRPASTMEWRKLNDHIGVELEINSSLERINKMVISSYNGLPFHLKACFLYLSIFPEGRNLRRRRLVRRWIAEGYSSKMLSLAAEEVGEKHFTDLLNRSMIQPSKATASNGEKVNLYQVNNLMHAISISKTTEEKLVCTLDDSTTNPNSRDKVRHLVVSRRCSRDKNNALVRMMDLSRIRSLTVFGEWQKHLVSSKMRLLRVLDLEDTTGLRDKDLEPIGKLRHLKFLSLRGSQGIFHLPRSFGKLLNLETLDIRGTLVTTLPGAIVKLQKLSYLRAGYIPSDEDDQSINVTEFIVTIVELLSQLCGSYRTKRSVDKEQMRVLNNFGPSIGFIRSVLLKGLDPHGVKVPKRIGKMKILHTLGVVNVARGKTIKELKTLTKLRKLGVTGINKKNGKDFCSAVEALSQLESLSVRSEGKHGLEGCLDDLSSPPKNLQSVKLYGHIAKLPTWINPEKLRNLSKLSLRSTCLEHDGALRDLEKLPKLVILCLWRDSFKECAVKEGALKEEGAPEEEGALKKQGALSLKFGPGTFPQLNKLEIADLDQLQWVVFENTAMAELEILQVDNCFDLDKGGFSGTDFLPKLKEVRVRGGYGDAFKKTLQEQVTKTTLIIMARVAFLLCICSHTVTPGGRRIQLLPSNKGGFYI